MNLRDSEYIDVADKVDLEAERLISELCEDIVWELLPAQYDFIDTEFNEEGDRYSEILFSSGYGTGKSRSLMQKITLELLKKSNRVLLLRKELVWLKKTTFLELIDENNSEKQVLPQNSYTYNRQSGEVRLYCGGTLMLAGLDKNSKVLSMSVGTIGIDEAVEFDKSDYNPLFSRLRLEGYSGTMLISTNPSSEQHWIYKEFFTKKDQRKKIITANTTSNFFLSRDSIRLNIIKHLEQGESEYKRLIQGCWTTSLGTNVYPNFSVANNVKEMIMDKNSPEYHEYIGLDHGYRNPLAIGLFCIDKNNIYLEQEVYATGMSQADVKEKINKMCIGRKNKPRLLIDPSCPELAEFIRRETSVSEVIPADNSIIPGIVAVNTRINRSFTTGQPTFFIHPSCKNTIDELGRYHYGKEDTEKPVAVDNHMCDVCRYVIFYEDSKELNRDKLFCFSIDDL
jgi:PBSX family phage terminase large subunit